MSKKMLVFLCTVSLTAYGMMDNSELREHLQDAGLNLTPRSKKRLDDKISEELKSANAWLKLINDKQEAANHKKKLANELDKKEKAAE